MNIAIACVTPLPTRWSSQYPSELAVISDSNKQGCAPSHSDKLELSFILSFEGREKREQREELSLDSMISSVRY